MTSSSLTPLAARPLSETPKERVDRLIAANSLLLTDTGEGSWTHDMVDWLDFLAVPCRVPARVRWLPDSALLAIGPDEDGGMSGAWLTVTVAFGSRGEWVSTQVSNEYSGKNVGLIPHPSWGIPCTVAAGLLAIQIEMNATPRRPSWMYWRQEREGSVRPVVGPQALEQDREVYLKRIRDLFITMGIRHRALESVSREHEEQFRSSFNAEIVMTAMSSDWYPQQH